MNPFTLLYFNKDFKIGIKASQLSVIKKLNSLLSKDIYTTGDVKGNEFAFMHLNFQPRTNPLSLFIFSGAVTGDNNSSEMLVKARLSKPMCYFYLLAALSFPIDYLLDIGHFKKNLPPSPFFKLFPFLMPILIYAFALFFYIIKINDVKIVLRRIKREVEK